MPKFKPGDRVVRFDKRWKGTIISQVRSKIYLTRDDGKTGKNGESWCGAASNYRLEKEPIKLVKPIKPVSITDAIREAVSNLKGAI